MRWQKTRPTDSNIGKVYLILQRDMSAVQREDRVDTDVNKSSSKPHCDGGSPPNLPTGASHGILNLNYRSHVTGTLELELSKSHVTPHEPKVMRVQ